MLIKKRKIQRYNKIPNEAQKIAISKEATAYLNSLYPGHLWAATVEQDMLYIINLTITSRKGFKMALWEVSQESLMRAGGECLERYNLRRAKACEKELSSLERDFMGEGVEC